MTAAQIVGLVITLLGAGTGITALILVPRQIQKLRAETVKVDADTGKVEVESSVLLAETEDAHFAAIIKLQTEALVAPLTARVATLEKQVDALEVELAASRRLARSALGYVRTLLSWINRHLDAVTEPVPAPPADVAGEL